MIKQKTGRLFIISAASGAGKTTIVKKLIDNLDNLKVSVSHTTRQPRLKEINEKDYFFVNTEEFNAMIKDNQFIEYANCHGNMYGTSRKSIEYILNNQQDAILEIDWQGARAIKKLYPEAISIFIMPPNIDTLRERLVKRDQDSLSVIENRMQAAKEEISHADEFDYVTINDNLDETIDYLIKVFLK